MKVVRTEEYTLYGMTHDEIVYLIELLKFPRISSHDETEPNATTEMRRGMLNALVDALDPGL